MELTELSEIKVIIRFDYLDNPPWFNNVFAYVVQAVPNWLETPVDMLYEHLCKWLEDRYQATFVVERYWTITFPNQERYLECVLAWS